MKTLNLQKFLNTINNKLLLALIFMLAVISSLSCVDSANDKQVITVNPFGVGIIVFNSIPTQFYGNGTDIDAIKVNTGLIPNGSTITAKITNSTLADELSGCVVSGSATVQNSQATFNFLAPIFIGNQGETQSVNLAVTIETPDGTKINDFVTLTILAVGVFPPAGDLTVNSASQNDLDAGFLNVNFTTVGFSPGTMATCTVSNPALGSLASGMVPVSGTKAQGSLLVQYLPAAGTPSGTQEVTCAIIIQNPSSVGASCSNVSVNDRTASATAVINQGASTDVTNPPAPNSMTCTPNPVTGGNGGTCTCNNDNAAGQTINFTGSANLMFVAGSATADVSGKAVLAFTTNIVPQTMMEQVSCGPAASMNVAQTTVTINPAGVNSLDCVPNPATSDDVPTQLICTCDTDSPLTQVCLEEFTDLGMAISGLPTCIDSDANGSAIFTPTLNANLMSASSATLQCCVSPDNTDCTGDLVAQDTVNINPFVPPVLSISCTAQDDNIGPGDDTIIDIATENVTTDVCAQIIIQTQSVSDGFSELSIPPTPPNGMDDMPENVCTSVDANGNAQVQFRGGDVDVADEATVRCYIDNNMENGMFDPGEISAIETITVDPAAGPTPVQVACSPNPATVLPGGDSLFTMTLMNAAPGTPTCFKFFSNTNPASSLSDDDEGPLTTVCSTTNLANQAFATFTADENITGLPQNANILCCADIGGGSADMDCTPADPQTLAGVEVNAPILTLSAVGDALPAAGEQRFINATTNPAAPNGTMICVYMSFDNTGGSTLDSTNDTSTTNTTSPPTATGDTLCETVTNGLGSVLLNYNLTINGGATSGDIVTVDGCIDTTMGGSCGTDEPPSANSLNFTVVP